MKNKTLAMGLMALSLVVVAVPLSADSGMGIRGGYVSSNFTKAGAGFFKNRHGGFYLGWFSDMKIVPMVYLGTGLEYYQAGSKKDDDNRLLLHYLSVPLSLKAKIGPIQGFAGLHGAVRVGSSLDVLGESIPAEGYSTFDAGAFVGLGVKILFIGAEAKYCWGFVDIKNGYKNNFFQGGLTLWF